METEVWITSSDYASQVCDLLPSNIGRALMVNSMIKCYKLDEKCRGSITVSSATKRDLEEFHGPSFVEQLLKKRSNEGEGIVYNDNEGQNSSDDTKCDGILESFGLLHDCPVFGGLDQYVKIVAGSSISASKKMVERADYKPICINWYGGRHHCAKNKASGFCYVNDIVLSINVLRSKFKHIFYLDIDLHHGDGVENAFKFSKNVTTCSIHRYDIGFFPGSGSLKTSSPTVFNIPTNRGLSDSLLGAIIEEIVLKIIDKKLVDAIVIQCGADGLLTDKHKEWNLTIKGLTSCIETVIKHTSKPALLLGGGGYNHTETAKFWTHLTNSVLGNDLIEGSIPEHEHLDDYEYSGYQFWYEGNLVRSKMKDENDSLYIEAIKNVILSI